MFAEGEHKDKLDIVVRKNICLAKSRAGMYPKHRQAGFLLRNRDLGVSGMSPPIQIIFFPWPEGCGDIFSTALIFAPLASIVPLSK